MEKDLLLYGSLIASVVLFIVVVCQVLYLQRQRILRGVCSSSNSRLKFELKESTNKNEICKSMLDNVLFNCDEAFITRADEKLTTEIDSYLCPLSLEGSEVSELDKCNYFKKILLKQLVRKKNNSNRIGYHIDE